MSSPYDDLAQSSKPEGELPMGKSLFQSKTFWFNAITFLVSVGTYLQGSELVAANPELVSILGVVVGVGNVILRLVTKEPVKLSGSKTEE